MKPNIVLIIRLEVIDMKVQWLTRKDSFINVC